MNAREGLKASERDRERGKPSERSRKGGESQGEKPENEIEREGTQRALEKGGKSQGEKPENEIESARKSQRAKSSEGKCGRTLHVWPLQGSHTHPSRTHATNRVTCAESLVADRYAPGGTPHASLRQA